MVFLTGINFLPTLKKACAETLQTTRPGESFYPEAPKYLPCITRVIMVISMEPFKLGCTNSLKNNKANRKSLEALQDLRISGFWKMVNGNFPNHLAMNT